MTAIVAPGEEIAAGRNGASARAIGRAVLAPTDPDWPLGLADLKDPPAAIDMEGDWPRDRPAVAIVGTRRATAEALEVTRVIAADLARAGALVVSGGAYGIDAAAHEGALSVQAPTVAILGTPLDRLYPADHRPLFARIRASGALASELPRGGGVRRGTFLARNRLIAAVARAVLVVQAPFKSGALSTAAVASQLGRPLFACPWSPLEEAAAGGLALLAEGRARLCRDARDVASVLGVAIDAPDRAAPPATVDDPHGVLRVIDRRPLHPDVLADRLGMPMHVLMAALLELELAGAIETVPGGVRRR